MKTCFHSHFYAFFSFTFYAIFVFSHFYAIFHEFLWRATNKLSFTMLSSYIVFKPFKMAVQFYFSQFDGPNTFPPKFNRPLAPTLERYEYPYV